ncbi:hypothetical protein BU24DRAFT_492867 [Aaosphaeria arxii CBS 175.79]|uniref:Uncharacterized protein n=1 Tax=Aaosphaeria arxii CBS 175.79 TaxID=1450172 RepID=A0A6A5XLZ3_9PLEO|nr:uncharacterized protein BU24DRAFT_492867 [Aaosphaeria arxii CBS 175.79]KAF2014162.1 hypothetical protein BU24DRAFT_492867 [Aaosphaeria arxii CBS 175.79]
MAKTAVTCSNSDVATIDAAPMEPSLDAASTWLGSSPRKHRATKAGKAHSDNGCYGQPLKATPPHTPQSHHLLLPPIRLKSAKTSTTEHSIMERRPIGGLSDPNNSQNSLALTIMPRSTTTLLDTENGIPTPATSHSNDFEIAHLRNEVNGAQSASNINTVELARQSDVIAHLSGINGRIFNYLRDLDNRIGSLEAENANLRNRLHDSGSNRFSVQHVSDSFYRQREPLRIQYGGIDDRSRSRSPTPERAEQSVSTSDALDLQDEQSASEIGQDATSGGASRSSVIGDSLIADAAPQQDEDGILTECKTEPQSPSKGRGRKRARNVATNKREVHKLDKVMVSSLVRMPKIPITDTEIIVYFFNSLSRPLVAGRLYSRGFGPAKITDTINEHRDLDPPFLRNTCSVKCVTAIRRGAERFKSEWESIRDQFSNASIAEATTLIRDRDRESTEDIDVRELLTALIKHPDEELHGVGGIFTRCVKFCEDKKLSWPLSQIDKLAAKIEANDLADDIAEGIAEDISENNGDSSSDLDSIDEGLYNDLQNYVADHESKDLNNM